MVARALSHQRTELDAGTRVGAYEVEDVRARLAHVVIYRARHIVTGRPVALQVLRPSADAALVRAIRRDLAALNRLRHANVAEILELGDLADGRPFLVVEWIAGRSLQTALEARGRFSVDETLPIADEIAAALTAAHALGVVHGALHARNVGLVAHGEHHAVKLASFGMTRLSGDKIAPEQRSDGRPEVKIDRRVDVFALGALVYQMVTGARPAADPPPPSTYATVPHAFDEVVLRCLRADPTRRWSSVDEVITALRAAAAGSELVAELTVTAFLDPAVDAVDAAALDDAERALFVAQRWLERQNLALVLPGAGAVVATARIPRALEQQRAARAGWVKLADAVRDRMNRRRTPHPDVRTKVQIRIDG
ncbi:MAG TPA: protein kinase [Polyangia bacterium]|jgi:serine/threonine-protein kinase